MDIIIAKELGLPCTCNACDYCFDVLHLVHLLAKMTFNPICYSSW